MPPSRSLAMAVGDIIAEETRKATITEAPAKHREAGAAMNGAAKRQAKAGVRLER